ncbi:MAG: hypothetical protein EA383_08510 [Spirochaetaceae bacterium]|nr:MAG: hypothetical protein EA383_08510 [Spirochaetaceae bacterium]
MLDDLVNRYRDRCLWFLRSDYLPETRQEAEAVLDLIERYGDRDAFFAVREARQWLSRDTNVPFSDSSPVSGRPVESDT